MYRGPCASVWHHLSDLASMWLDCSCVPSRPEAVLHVNRVYNASDVAMGNRCFYEHEGTDCLPFYMIVKRNGKLQVRGWWLGFPLPHAFTYQCPPGYERGSPIGGHIWPSEARNCSSVFVFIILPFSVL